MRGMMSVVLVAGLLVSVAQGTEQVEARGKVNAVTLYRGQALVTRTVSFDAPAGGVQLTVTDLPESVMSQSLHASAGKGVAIRAVRYRARARSEAPQPEVRKLDEQIRELDRAMRKNASDQRLAGQQGSYLDGLRGFVAPTVKVEMAKGVLNADMLEKLTGMMFERRTELAKRKLELDEQLRDLREKVALLHRQRSALTRTHSKTAREAIVFLDKAAAGKAEIRLHYLVSNATWEPTYNLRASGEMTKVSVEYSALARQMTGEDWDQVKLTLSAAGAQMVAEGPSLAPLRITLAKAKAAYKNPQVEQQMREQRRQLSILNTAMQQTWRRDKQIAVNWDMNLAANVWQYNELMIDAKDLYVVQKPTGAAPVGLSANYKLDGRVSFASRRESQMIEIARFELPAKLHYEAVPLLTEYVFRYARLTNNSKLSLLEGRSNAYIDGDFVGRGTVPMMARGQQATVGFGMDPQLRAWREFVSKTKSDEWLGGNRRTKLSYRLVLHNYSDKPVKVRLLDRTPIATDELKVDLGDTSEPLSKDAEYIRRQRPRGILRWEATVPAKAAAGTPKIVEYSYTLTHAKDLYIGGRQAPQAAAEMKKMFEKDLRKGIR